MFISKGKIAQVEDTIVHPKYNSSTKINDIAILHVTPVDLTLNRTKSICLPEIDDDPLNNTMLIVTGWGRVNNRTFESPTHLMAVDVPVVERNHCGKVMKEYQMKTWNTTRFTITKGMFCAGYEQGKKDSCQVSF